MENKMMVKEELKEKINQLNAGDCAKVAYLFADSVRKFLTDKRSIDALDLLERYHANEDVNEVYLSDLDTYAVADAAVAAAAVAAFTAAADVAVADAAVAAVAVADVAIAADAAAFAATFAVSDAFAVAHAAVADAAAAAADNAADHARKADSSITIESQIKIVDELIEDAILNKNVTKVC